jgi:hypothetical protein
VVPDGAIKVDWGMDVGGADKVPEPDRVAAAVPADRELWGIPGADGAGAGAAFVVMVGAEFPARSLSITERLTVTELSGSASPRKYACCAAAGAVAAKPRTAPAAISARRRRSGGLDAGRDCRGTFGPCRMMGSRSSTSVK